MSSPRKTYLPIKLTDDTGVSGSEGVSGSGGVSGVITLPDNELVELPHPEPKAKSVSSITEVTAKNSLRFIFYRLTLYKNVGL